MKEIIGFKLIYLQKMLTALQDLGSTNEHGHMSIVPTSMHFAGYFALVLPFHSFLQLFINTPHIRTSFANFLLNVLGWDSFILMKHKNIYIHYSSKRASSLFNSIFFLSISEPHIL